MARNKTTSEHTNTPPEVQRAVAHVGLFTRVAKSLGMSPTHVVRVAKQMRQSDPVLKAIVKEVRRIERTTERAA